MGAALRSQIAGETWPSLPSPSAALLAALSFQLEHTQWWSAERLREHQLMQLTRLLRHARDTVPWYSERLPVLPRRGCISADAWHGLPLLARRELQQAESLLSSRAVPEACGAVSITQTSGSTGEPVRLGRTALDALYWKAHTLRDHRWHERDLTAKLALIRVAAPDTAPPPHGQALPGWGAPSDELYRTGPAVLLNLSTDIERQLGWLQQQRPDYLLTYASNLAALLEASAASGKKPQRLRGVTTVGETVTPELRARARAVWDTPITDIYSSQELGYIALQCPYSGQYHAMSESVLVEVLDDAGRPCAPGEIGRLVVSSLHGYATPLIRYELRDYAEMGEPCVCGRGLTPLARIVGRSRNLVTLPDGRRHWPLVGFARYRGVAPVRQYQLVQHTREEIEVRLVTERALTATEEAALGAVICESLGAAFRLRYAYFENELPRAANGKFEEFVSKLE